MVKLRAAANNSSQSYRAATCSVYKRSCSVVKHGLPLLGLAHKLKRPPPPPVTLHIVFVSHPVRRAAPIIPYGRRRSEIGILAGFTPSDQKSISLRVAELFSLRTPTTYWLPKTRGVPIPLFHTSRDIRSRSIFTKLQVYSNHIQRTKLVLLRKCLEM